MNGAGVFKANDCVIKYASLEVLYWEERESYFLRISLATYDGT